jgi:eukaryotic-like serine/threonine-protein kinase
VVTATFTVTSQSVIPSHTIEPSPTSIKIFTPTANPLSTEITDSRGVRMVFVPAGEFTMGSEKGNADEKPVHQVYLDDYYIDEYEVTNFLYKTCVSIGVCQPPKNDSSYSRANYYNDLLYNNYPVIYIDWFMAKNFCEWRGARLPTEAEWEKAARGLEERTYPWGNGFDCHWGNFDDETQLDSYLVPGGPNCDGYYDTAPVGSYVGGISSFGAYDMAGNVWEWVADWYVETYYQNSPPSNPIGPNTGNYRILRGGSWESGGSNIRASNRARYDPADFSYYFGFRCAKDANP